MSDGLLITILATCILTEGFFSGSEIALVSADRLRLRTEAQGGSRSAALALKMLDSPARTLGMCLIGTNVSTITAATVAALLVSRHYDAPEVLATLLVVPLTLTFGEMVPKTLYQHHANRMVQLIVFPLHSISTAFTPVLWLLAAITNALGGDEDDRPGITRGEIRLLLDDAETQSISASDRVMINRVFEFSEAVVEDAMVPLIEVVAVSCDLSLAAVAQRMVDSGHSRLPVFKGRVDHVVGVIFHHDLLVTDDWDQLVTEVMRPPLFIPETKPVDDLLRELRRKRQRLAVVVDEYGGAVGLITVEDLLEEIVGEIEDESDVARPMLSRIGEREWRAEGRSEREHLEEACGLQLPDGDFETVAGFMLSVLGRVPRAGETVEHGGFTLQVGKATDRAILEVVLKRRS